MNTILINKFQYPTNYSVTNQIEYYFNKEKKIYTNWPSSKTLMGKYYEIPEDNKMYSIFNNLSLNIIGEYNANNKT